MSFTHNRLTKEFLKFGLVAVFLLMGAAASKAERVAIGEFKYANYQAIMHLIKALVEDRLGGEVEIVPANNALMYAGMDRGKGEIDVHADVWIPNQRDFMEKYVIKNETVVYSKNTYEARTGFCVPKYFAEEHNVQSVFDLARPEIAAMLDSDGNGKGEIYIGLPGSAQVAINHVKLRDYGLLVSNDRVEADFAVNYAALGDAVRKRKGYAFFCWAPDGVWQQHDLVQLEEPPHDSSCVKMVQPKEDPDWLKKSKITCADATKQVQIAYSKSLEKRSPTITSLLANIALDTELVSSWAFEIGSKKREPAEVMKEWIKNNPERVDSWFGL
jgi:glycine betaine/proline transport system substrate-binding protein